MGIEVPFLGDSNQRHAYLITAFDNPYVLEKTIQLLDHPDNDIYIHFDIKMEDTTPQYFQSLLKHSSIHFTTRKNVYWGDYSYTDVILDLLEAAQSGQYHYYHLITGTSMPIKPQAEIHAFFQSQNHLFFHVNANVFKSIQDRVKAYYPFINTSVFRKHKSIKFLSLIIGKAQILCGVNRLRHNMDFPQIYNGWGWFSLPHDFVSYVLTKRPAIQHTFHHTLAADEVFIQTVAMNSDYAKRVITFDRPIVGSKHFQDWKRGKPYVFRLEDFDLLFSETTKDCFFARKFDQRVDLEIINKVFDQVNKRQVESNKLFA